MVSNFEAYASILVVISDDDQNEKKEIKIYFKIFF